MGASSRGWGAATALGLVLCCCLADKTAAGARLCAPSNPHTPVSHAAHTHTHSLSLHPPMLLICLTCTPPSPITIIHSIIMHLHKQRALRHEPSCLQRHAAVSLDLKHPLGEGTHQAVAEAVEAL